MVRSRRSGHRLRSCPDSPTAGAHESAHWDTQVVEFWAEMRDTLVKLPTGSFPPTVYVEAVVQELPPLLHR